MPDVNPAIPGFLKKKGITSLNDNVPENHSIRLPQGSLFAFFGDSLMAELSQRNKARPAGSEK